MYNRKKTFMSTSFNINTQRTNTKTMNLNQLLLLIQISVHGCSYTTLYFSPMLFFLISIMLQMHNEGVYISFPSCTLNCLV